MKYHVTAFYLFVTLWVNAQNTDSLVIDNHPFLNVHEVELLNVLLGDVRADFDFTGKKVAFITGNTGRTVVSKSNYFKHSVIPWIENGAKPQIFMEPLTEEEKVRSGGYDVLVMSWVKVYTPKTHRKVIAELGAREEITRQPK